MFLKKNMQVKRVPAPILILLVAVLSVILAACGGGSTVNTPGAPAGINTPVVVPTGIAASSSDVATAVARANATQGSPFVRAHPAPRENHQANPRRQWTTPPPA